MPPPLRGGGRGAASFALRPRTRCEIRCARLAAVPRLAMRVPATGYVASLAMVRRTSLGPARPQASPHTILALVSLGLAKCA